MSLLFRDVNFVFMQVQKDTPVCDFMKRQGVLSWAASDNPDQSSDSDCEEPDKLSYKVHNPIDPSLIKYGHLMRCEYFCVYCHI